MLKEETTDIEFLEETEPIDVNNIDKLLTQPQIHKWTSV